MNNQVIELTDVKKLNEEIFNTFTRHHEKILSVIKTLNKCLTDDFEINTDLFFEIRRKDETVYEDDGNTKAKGVEWSATWAFPLNKRKKEEYYWGSIESEYCSESIIFTLNNFNERLSDKKISGCKFFSLYFNFGAYKDIINIGRDNKQLIRLDYQNNNYSEMAIMKTENFAKIISCIRKLKEAVNIVKEISFFKFE